MKKLAAALLVSLPFCLGTAFAKDEPKKEMTEQQKKMAECSAQNKGKKGEEYKAAQKACLAGEAPAKADKPMTQQEKMKKCSAENKGKTGEEYKKAQKECLSK
jgi:membrane-bound lytic murein transglycosylase